MDSQSLVESNAITAKVVIDTSAICILFIWAVPALVLMNAFPDSKRQPFHHLTKEERHRRTKWFHMPPMTMVRTLQFFANAFMAVAATYYLYMYRNPATTTEQNYYLSIGVLLFVLAITKQFWQHFQFNHFDHNIGVALGILTAVLNTGLAFTSMVLLFVRGADIPGGFMIATTIYYIWTIGWAGHIAQHHWDPDW